MFEGIEIEIFEIQHPPIYEEASFSYSIHDDNKEYEFFSNSKTLFIPIQQIPLNLKFALYNKTKEIGRSILQIPEQENPSKVQTLKFQDQSNERKQLSSRNPKQITLHCYLKLIFSHPTQEYLNYLKSFVSYLLSNRETFSLFSSQLEKISSPSTEKTIDLLENQLCEKNKIIHSFLKEFHELRKNSNLVSTENVELKRKLTESLSRVVELTNHSLKKSENDLKNSENLEKDKEIENMRIEIGKITEKYLKVFQSLEEKSKDFHFIIGKLVSEKNFALRKCEELEKNEKNFKNQVEELEIQNISLKSQIFIQDSFKNLTNHYESQVSVLESQLNIEKERYSKLIQEFNEQVASKKDQSEEILRNNSEILSLTKKTKELQSNLDSVNFQLLTLSNEITEKEAKSSKLSKSLKKSENLQKNNEILLETIENLTKNLKILESHNQSTSQKLENLDQTCRNLSKKYSTQSTTLKEKEEELESLKEIIIAIQKLPQPFSHHGDSIDEQVSEYLLNSKSCSRFTHESKGVYSFEGQKVYIKRLEKRLFASINGLDIPIEEFFEEFFLKQLTKIQEKKKEKLKILASRNCHCKIKTLSPSNQLKENLGSKSFNSSQKVYMNKSARFL